MNKEAVCEYFKLLSKVKRQRRRERERKRETGKQIERRDSQRMQGRKESGRTGHEHRGNNRSPAHKPTTSTNESS